MMRSGVPYCSIALSAWSWALQADMLLTHLVDPPFQGFAYVECASREALDKLVSLNSTPFQVRPS